MMEWQPIETAPKDGTFIDVWCSGLHNPAGARETDAYWDGTQWMCKMFERGGPFTVGFYVTDKPTHWMPLPPPPQGT